MAILNINYLIISFFLFLCFINTGDSIQCWYCNSRNDPKCADPFDNSTINMKNCAFEQSLSHYPKVKATMCRKIRQKVHGEWRYFRDCAYLGEPGIGGDERYCLMRTGSYNIFVEICTCVGKDGCNSAVSLQIHALILILIIGNIFAKLI
ncbi:hypothetical protein PGB90_005901 [Kerria lacca]